jgi:hypothetical protein
MNKVDLLRKLVREELESYMKEEVNVDELTNVVNEFIRLQAELDNVEIELQPILDAQKSKGKLRDATLAKIESMLVTADEKEKIAGDWAVKLETVAKYKKIQPAYKELWEESLTKVNSAIKNVLMEFERLHKESKSAETKNQLSIGPIKENTGSPLSGLVKAYSELIKSINELPDVDEVQSESSEFDTTTNSSLYNKEKRADMAKQTGKCPRCAPHGGENAGKPSASWKDNTKSPKQYNK